jgi:hypothetical protein
MSRLQSVPLWSLVLVTSACGGSGGRSDPDAAASADAGDDPDAARPDATPVETRTITGVAAARHVTPAGEVVVPYDLSSVEIAVRVPPTFEVYPGTGTAEGTFSIPGVPVGTYYLQIGTGTVLVATADDIDLRGDVLGRPDATPVTVSPTDLVLDVDNLAPWQEGDELQMYSAGSATVAFAMQDAATAGAPVTDDVALAGFTYDVAGAADSLLVDGEAGDQLVVTQLAVASFEALVGILYRRVTRAYLPGPFTMIDGEPTALDGAFVEVPQTSSFAFDWDRSSFDTVLRAGAPLDETLVYPQLTVHTLPEAADRGIYFDSADLLSVRPGWTDDLSSLAVTLDHGDPYPAEWTRLVTASHTSYRYIGVGDAIPRPIYSQLFVELDRADVSAEAPITPLVGPVLQPRIDGRDAFGPLDGVGDAPAISWQPPAVGTASGYAVLIAELHDDAGSTAIRGVARFRTTATTLALPPGTLEDGSTYIFYIAALSTPGIDLDATPYKLTLPAAIAETAIGPATP